MKLTALDFNVFRDCGFIKERILKNGKIKYYLTKRIKRMLGVK